MNTSIHKRLCILTLAVVSATAFAGPPETSEPVSLEVVRHVLGNITEVGQDGKIEMVNVLEDSSYAPSGGVHPYWWNWWSWPYWWSHFNSVGRITWNLKLDAGKSIELKYTWHYYWR